MKIAVSELSGKNSGLFLKIAGVYVIATTIIFLLPEQGVFGIFSVLPLAEFFKIPTGSIVPLTSYVASPTLGILLLGLMIHSGEIKNIQAMIVLMLSSMFTSPIKYRSIIQEGLSVGAFGVRAQHYVSYRCRSNGTGDGDEGIVRRKFL